MNIKDIVKDYNMCSLIYYRQGNIWYKVRYNDIDYKFPVLLKDIGDASLIHSMKAITLMRYIRKGIEDGTFVECGKDIIDYKPLKHKK